MKRKLSHPYAVLAVAACAMARRVADDDAHRHSGLHTVRNLPCCRLSGHPSTPLMGIWPTGCASCPADQR